MLKELFESEGDDLRLSIRSVEERKEARANSLDISLVKQFLIEFQFLKAVSEQELERIRDPSSAASDSQTNAE